MRQVPDSVARARRSLGACLRDAGASPIAVADAEVVFGELVANAVEHGRPDAEGMIEVGWRLLPGAVQVGVHDWGHVDSLHPRAAGPADDRGRGLALVETLSERWSYREDDGTRVGAELRLTSRR